MNRKVLLSNLTVGKCFTTIALEPQEVVETPKSAKIARPILAPEDAWRITDVDAQVQAQNARGETKAWDPATKVVEIPRQGFDTLASRPDARDGPKQAGVKPGAPTKGA